MQRTTTHAGGNLLARRSLVLSLTSRVRFIFGKQSEIAVPSPGLTPCDRQAKTRPASRPDASTTFPSHEAEGTRGERQGTCRASRGRGDTAYAEAAGRCGDALSTGEALKLERPVDEVGRAARAGEAEPDVSGARAEGTGDGDDEARQPGSRC